ncbi:MAG: hypothetical protein AAF492_08965 [Verrucomicrobiota bacterium]
MNKIEDYYRRVEPSSPVPLILGRAKKLVGCSFIDVLKDIAQSAITEVETIAGKSVAEISQEGEPAEESA